MTNVFTFPQTKGTDQWLAQLRKHVQDDLLPLIIPDKSPLAEKWRKVYTSDLAMQIWKVTYTHPSYDTRVDHNFEVKEYIGDRYLSYSLGVYMKRLYPDATHDNLTNYNTSFTSRKPLAIIAEEKNMLKHVRTFQYLEKNKEKSDVFEAVVYAIIEIGNRYIARKIGLMLVDNFLFQVYNWFRQEHSQDKGKSGVINRVTQDYFNAMGWKKESEKLTAFEEWDPVDNLFTVKLNNRAIKMLREMGKGDLIGETKLVQGKEEAVLATGTGDSKKEAANDAYTNALNRLQRDFGISETQAREIGIKNLIDDQIDDPKEAKQFQKRLTQQMKKDGIIWFRTPNYMSQPMEITIRDGTRMVKPKPVYNLIGKGTGDTYRFLYRFLFSANPKDNGWTDDQIRLELYRHYANNGIMDRTKYELVNVNK